MCIRDRISSSGTAAISAVSMVDSINVFFLNVFVALATGGTVVVAQYKGVENRDMVSRSAAQAIAVVPLVALALAVLMILFRRPILMGMFGQAEAAVLENADLYFLGSCISYPSYAAFQAVCCTLRGVGETRPSLMISLSANLALMLSNVLFITVLHLGVLGLSFSLNFARILGTVIGLIYLVKFDRSLSFRLRSLLRFDFSIQKKILLIGIPFAAENVFFNGGKMLTQTFIVQLGTLALATNAISNSFFMVLQIPSNALSLAVVTVVGQCMGRRSIDDSRKLVRSFLVLSSGAMLLTSLIILPLYPILVQLFSPDPSIVDDIFQILIVCTIGHPTVWSFSFILPSAMRAAGDAKFTSITAFITMWSVRVVVGYLLGITLHFGLIGIWIAMIIEWAVRGLIFFFRFRGSKWCTHHLID